MRKVHKLAKIFRSKLGGGVLPGAPLWICSRLQKALSDIDYNRIPPYRIPMNARIAARQINKWIKGGLCDMLKNLKDAIENEGNISPIIFREPLLIAMAVERVAEGQKQFLDPNYYNDWIKRPIHLITANIKWLYNDAHSKGRFDLDGVRPYKDPLFA
tara:strand:+ start:84 stop:557 length:474 start_codon:yes stop_codon:yes gene_type:complete